MLKFTLSTKSNVRCGHKSLRRALCSFKGNFMASQGREFRVRLFGKFEISDGERTLTDNDINSGMVTKLAALLIGHRETGCSSHDLIDALWPDADSNNPQGALKNLVYRLRKKFSQVWPDTECVLTSPGGYILNPDIPLALDTDEFTEAHNAAESAADDAGRVQALKKMIEVYRGRLLVDYSPEHWVIPLQAFYHNTWLRAAHTLSAILEAGEKYGEVVEVCQKAVLIDPHDEQLHCGLIRGLIGENRFPEAEDHYRKVLRILYNEIGEQPGGELRRLYDLVMQQHHREERDLEKIERDLAEGSDSGRAFFCVYGTFKKIYELQKRRLEREEKSIVIALLSFSQSANDEGVYPKTVRDMDILRNVLSESLRSGDVITRYSSTQYLVMLPGCGEKEAVPIMERLLKDYYASPGRSRAKVRYTMKCLLEKREDKRQ